MDAVYQKEEGPAIAKRILESLGYASEFIERVCFIVGHHHTPSIIDGIDFQIQWEEDLLTNLEYMPIKEDKDKLKQYIEDNFKARYR